MRIARITDEAGVIHHAAPTGDPEIYEKLEGSWSEGFGPVAQSVRAARLLAPVVPPAVHAKAR